MYDTLFRHSERENKIEHGRLYVSGRDRKLKVCDFLSAMCGENIPIYDRKRLSALGHHDIVSIPDTLKLVVQDCR
jgi:hypothetical protein